MLLRRTLRRISAREGRRADPGLQGVGATALGVLQGVAAWPMKPGGVACAERSDFGIGVEDGGGHHFLDLGLRLVAAPH
jgi:hypothetical protein